MELTTQHLTKQFKDMTAVNDVSLQITLAYGDFWAPTEPAKRH